VAAEGKAAEATAAAEVASSGDWLNSKTSDFGKMLGGLSDQEIFDSVVKLEVELTRARATLALKAPRLTKTEGVLAYFEGTPIDCGAVADVVVSIYLQSMSTPELEAVTVKTEAELAAATSALAAMRNAPPAAKDKPQAAKAPQVEAATAPQGEAGKAPQVKPQAAAEGKAEAAAMGEMAEAHAAVASRVRMGMRTAICVCAVTALAVLLRSSVRSKAVRAA